MNQDDQNCDCSNEKKNCCEEVKLDEISKEDLLARKTCLEKCLKEVDEVLTKSE